MVILYLVHNFLTLSCAFTILAGTAVPLQLQTVATALELSRRGGVHSSRAADETVWPEAEHSISMSVGDYAESLSQPDH